MTAGPIAQELRAALTQRNLSAFLHVIRTGEGTADVGGYSRIFGGAQFASFADHPRQVVTATLGGTPIRSTAAGAYQFLSRTWDECRDALALPDFSPDSQDLAAAYLIRRRGALADACAGRLEDAIAKCAREWASLPGSPYGQPTITLEMARNAYARAGGQLYGQPPAARPPQPHEPAAPQAHPAPPAPTTQTGAPAMVAPLIPFIAAALPALIEAAPALIRIFGDSPSAERNAKAAEAVAEIAKQATGQPTVEGAVQVITTDPAVAAIFRERCHQSMGELLQYLLVAQDSDDKSRDRALARNLELAKATGGRWLWLLGGAAALVLIMSYAITVGVLFKTEEAFSNETKALLLGQIVIFGFMTVLAFLFGSNIQNRISQNTADNKPGG